MKVTSFRFCLTLLTGFLLAHAEASTLKPPVLPLVVRNPYLSTWVRARDPPWTRWPIFWNGADIGMSFMAYVPKTKQIYSLFGRPQDSLPSSYNISFPEYVGFQFDASTSNFTYRIPGSPVYDEPLELTISFLSPITPTSTLRQSIPASYISVSASGSFDVEIYMDLNGMWVTGDRGAGIAWSMTSIAYDNTTTLQSWQIKKSEESLFTEYDEHGEWGTLFFTGPSDAKFESGTSAILRQGFAKTGTLNNRIDGKFRGVMDDEPVFAFQKTLKPGHSNSSTSSVLFTIAHIQDPIVQFASARGLTAMKPLWQSWFLSTHALITFHYLDYTTASMLASDYSTRLAKDAYNTGADDYMDIVALSARQVLGATTFSGTQDDPLIFLKEISSNGNTQTVDIIFPAFPFFMYTNPRWLAYLLEPLLEHQLSGQYPNKYSMHDLGAHFPNFTGHADGRDEYMPVEECGDMLIMGLALVNSLRHSSTAKSRSLWPIMNLNVAAQPSGSNMDASVFALSIGGDAQDTRETDPSWASGAQGEKVARAWLEKSYRIWKQWTEYLVEFSLEPANQLCTDDFAGWLPLQTNLALKGIIGIKAMSELAAVMGNHDEVKYYQNISTVYASKWATYGLSRDGSHAKLAYDWYGSWTTLYSLFPSSLLCFQSANPPFLPHGIYKNQSLHYSNVLQRYGLPLDSRHLYTKSDWALEAAAVASPGTRKAIVESVARWLNETETDTPFSDLYDTEGRGGYGAGNRFTARMVVGAHFAALALGEACGGEGKAVGGLWDE